MTTAAFLAFSIDGNVIGLLIFAAVAFINWLAQRKAGEKAPEDESGSSADRRRAEPTAKAPGEDERLRKFLEALGVPQEPVAPRRKVPPQSVPRSFQPPPLHKVRPRSTAGVPPLAVGPVNPFRVEVPAPAPVPAPLFKAPPPSSPIIRDEIEEIGVMIGPMETSAFDEAIAFGEITSAGASPSAAGRLFSSRDDLKRAVILREVLGMPRGLQTLESIG